MYCPLQDQWYDAVDIGRLLRIGYYRKGTEKTHVAVNFRKEIAAAAAQNRADQQ
jgi:hypothetical protein